MEDGRKALIAGQNKGLRKPFTCHYCHKPGHFKKDCRKCLAAQKKQTSVAEKKEIPGSDGDVFVTIHALAAISGGTWIVDSGATCHMCNYKNLFTDMRDLDTPQQVTLGDGSPLEGPAEGTVKLDMILPDGRTQNCKLKMFCMLLSFRIIY